MLKIYQFEDQRIPIYFSVMNLTRTLSPGHGKAHMCAPHAAVWRDSLLRHSELGYRLLPGNTFAVNNYILYLEISGDSSKAFIGLAKEGIENDPYDPTNYHRIIEIYTSQNKYSKALDYAEKLSVLYGPPINDRTLYCLKQNPALKKMLESGQYDPAHEHKKLLVELKKLVMGSE